MLIFTFELNKIYSALNLLNLETQDKGPMKACGCNRPRRDEFDLRPEARRTVHVGRPSACMPGHPGPVAAGTAGALIASVSEEQADSVWRLCLAFRAWDGCPLALGCVGSKRTYRMSTNGGTVRENDGVRTSGKHSPP